MLQLTNVAYAYADAAALRDVTLAIDGAAGSVVALTGPNGSGKSTLLKVIARVLTPLKGEVRFLGKPLAGWHPKEYARQVGYLPQEADAFVPMRALDVVLSGRAPFLGRFTFEQQIDYAEAEKALAACDAAHLAERYLDEMSGGERKRVFLARVLAGTPRLILLDEPLAALDVSHVQQIAGLLRTIADRSNCTIVFASHDLNWAAACSDRMLVMQGGSIAVDAPPAEVMREAIVRRFFDFHAAEVVAGGRTWIVPRVVS